MDTDSQPDISDEAHAVNSIGHNLDHPEDSGSSKAPRQIDKLPVLPPKPNSQTQHHSGQRWKSLQDFYRDGYAELLRSEIGEGSKYGVPPIDLGPSQVGAVMWSSAEKENLYQALSRKGRRDLPSLAQAIGSKSQLEIQDYLLLLREKESERHLFHRQTKIISHADVPAAVEISPDIEEVLEQAANAQLAYEEHYEHVVGAQKRNGPWIINREVAEGLDAEHDRTEETLLERDDSLSESTSETSIFHISNFIDLSERIFMNYGDSSSHENWQEIAMECETPGLTKEVIAEFYDLAVNFTRKLLQTSLFLAHSRQRSTEIGRYRHRAIMREQDVAAAVNVLDLKCDLWDFWVGVPRRNNLHVVDDKRVKGHGQKKAVPYEVVEQILSKRKSTWRGRRRSSSAGTDTSMTEEKAFDTADQMDEDSSEGRGSSSDSPVQPSTSSTDEEAHEPEAHPLDAILDSEVSESSPEEVPPYSPNNDSAGSDEFGGLAFHAATPRHKRRQIYLEHQQDEYLDQIDAEASREEEGRVLEILRCEVPTNTKPEKVGDTKMPTRPKVLRKRMDDLKDPLETLRYGAEWELLGATVPNESFVDTERARKRPRRMVGGVSSTRTLQAKGRRRELPLRTRSASTRSSLDRSGGDSDDEL